MDANMDGKHVFMSRWMFLAARTLIFTLLWLFSVAITEMDHGDKNEHGQLIDDLLVVVAEHPQERRFNISHRVHGVQHL